ncbi:hypothetical protein HanLR1_Chr13g0481481 [Helianthus annuus]|nr:hypothetical protein HanHA89_Chr13g0511461 [Helianthus annuus]KAJ0663463.1 hypothetical protein HanLR1_Chr13g0481481 [Helianthus annuus]
MVSEPDGSDSVVLPLWLSLFLFFVHYLVFLLSSLFLIFPWSMCRFESGVIQILIRVC